MAPVPPTAAENPSRAELRRTLDALSRSYRDHVSASHTVPDESPTIDRMHKRVFAQRLRIERLEHEAAALIAEITRLDDEVHGREKALALMLQTVLGRLQRTHAAAWSPVPILGYRLWLMRNGELWGARKRWTEPHYAATCSASAGPVPHTDGRCGRLGCGVYATKELVPLLDLHVRSEHHSYVAALVALRGTVVEHERGYRGSAAEVVSAYAVWPDRTMATSDPQRLADLFGACDRIPGSWCELRPGDDPLPNLITYLIKNAREHARWI